MRSLASRFVLLLVVAAIRADGRTLTWTSLQVQATLEREGALYVSERHSMRFDGQWNGGERIFELRPLQALELESVSRMDPTDGGLRPLSPASGKSIGLHQYAFDGKTLRWRAREADDPPFADTELTYVIVYRLLYVVEREGDGWILSHDFAFPQRPGTIERYALDFDLDPVWTPRAEFSETLEREDLEPGESVVVTLPLVWGGQGQPMQAFVPPPPKTSSSSASVAPDTPQKEQRIATTTDKTAGVGLFLLLAAALWYRLIHRDTRSGRYEKAPAITPDWLEENLLPHRPEVVGAAWDNEAGNGEVAALIARMLSEKKIAEVKAETPRLRLLVPRDSLSDYERKFVDALFVAGDEIDPETLRKVYAASGFDPASAIRGPLLTASRSLVGKAATGDFLLPLFVGVGTYLTLQRLIPVSPEAEFIWRIGGAVLCILAAIIAAVYRSSLAGRAGAALIPLPLILLVAFGTSWASGLAGFGGFFVVAIAGLMVVFRVARWKGSASELQNRRNLPAAREYFRRLLEAGGDIEERWVPYLLAFGLGDALDRWSVAAPDSRLTSPAAERRTFKVESQSNPGETVPSASAANATQFSSGGGGFGGAGASGGWSSAINSFAASVPAPSSSRRTESANSPSWSGDLRTPSRSTSDSSSSGGSRSGGGGGGGW